MYCKYIRMDFNDAIVNQENIAINNAFKALLINN